MLKKIFVLGVFVILAAGAAGCKKLDERTALIYEAYKTGRPIPVISIKYPDMNSGAAYSVQKEYVEKRLRKDKIAGFKAGVTSEASQKKFNVDEPLAGILFVSGKRKPGVEIDASKFGRLMIETEIGFITGKEIIDPLSSTAELKDYINAVVPAIELPDLGFEDIKKLKGVDIIAANVASASFIIGHQHGKDMDVNNVVVSLSRDGAVVNVGKGSDAIGDQWEAALWLVNTTVKNGWKIGPGAILITGALGDMLPGKPGNYTADFGPLGKISFEIK